MYSERIKINYEKLNGNFASITKLIDIAQQTSISQTESTSRNVEWYYTNNKGWLFLNWNVKIKKYPRFGEEVICYTAPVKFRKFLGQRDFKIEDLKGNVIMLASIKTALLDLGTKKPIEPSKELLAEYGEEDKGFITNKFKILKVDDNGFKKVSTKDILVRRLDTDTNKHTNNTKYIEWAENEIPEEIYNKGINEVKVVYKNETLEGDVVNVETFVNDTYIIVLFKKEKTLCCEIMFTYNNY